MYSGPNVLQLEGVRLGQLSRLLSTWSAEMQDNWIGSVAGKLESENLSFLQRFTNKITGEITGRRAKTVRDCSDKGQECRATGVFKLSLWLTSICS